MSDRFTIPIMSLWPVFDKGASPYAIYLTSSRSESDRAKVSWKIRYPKDVLVVPLYEGSIVIVSGFADNPAIDVIS